MLDIVMLVAGMAVLIKAADMLVEGASSLAFRFGISALTIGLTVVSLTRNLNPGSAPPANSASEIS